MRILVAPDRLPGPRSLSAAETAAAAAAGWAQAAPGDRCERLPLSDGGPGFLDALLDAVGGEVSAVAVRDPYGTTVPARVVSVGSTAYVEAAEAVGLHLVSGHRHDPLAASSAGVADLLRAAVSTGCERLVVGVGGTATSDGGRGLVQDLGGAVAARELLAGVELVAATATDAPLLGPSGVAHGFAAGKGVDRVGRETVEDQLRAWATSSDGGLAVKPGAGSGGGIGYGLLLLGATRVNGTELVTGLVGLAARAATVDLVLTVVHTLDWEALRGRVPVGVARAAQRAGRPTVVLAARVEVGRRELSASGIDAAYAWEDLSGDPAVDPAVALARAAHRVARTWSR